MVARCIDRVTNTNLTSAVSLSLMSIPFSKGKFILQAGKWETKETDVYT